MKSIIFGICLFLFGLANAQGVEGKWNTYDDTTGNHKSVVKIYKEGNKYYGKIIKIIDPKKQEAICELCKGYKKDQPINGLVIIEGLEEDDDEFNGGTITDPNSGKVYKCYIQLQGNNKLKVRGYIGFSFLGRTQYWTRIKS